MNRVSGSLFEWALSVAIQVSTGSMPWSSLATYVLVGLVLLISRLTGLKGPLTGVTINHGNILGAISHSWQWALLEL